MIVAAAEFIERLDDALVIVGHECGLPRGRFPPRVSISARWPMFLSLVRPEKQFIARWRAPLRSRCRWWGGSLSCSLHGPNRGCLGEGMDKRLSPLCASPVVQPENAFRFVERTVLHRRAFCEHQKHLCVGGTVAPWRNLKIWRLKNGEDTGALLFELGVTWKPWRKPLPRARPPQAPMSWSSGCRNWCRKPWRKTPHYKMDQDAPVADPSELADYDGIVFATPTRYGMMASQMKNFLDQTGALWATGALVGKVGSVMTSSATPAWRPGNPPS